MVEATLKIANTLGGSTWTYGNATFSKEQLQSSTRLRDDGTIEVGHLEVMIYSPTFMGASSPLTLPERYPAGHAREGQVFRPRVVLELDGEAVFEGTTSKGGIATDPADESGSRIWNVRLEDTALSDTLEQLRAANIYDAPLLAVYGRDTHWIEANTGWPASPNDADPVRWYKVPQVWRTLIEELEGLSIGTQITLFPNALNPTAEEPVMCSVESSYTVGGAVLFPHTLPEWTGEEFLEALQGITGMRLRAEYDPFPAGTVTLHEIEGEWTPAVGTLPDLTDRQGDPYDLSTQQPAEPDFALWYELGQRFGGSYAARERRPFGSGEEPPNDGLQSIPFGLPTYTDKSSNGSPVTGTPNIGNEGAFISAQEAGDLVYYRYAELSTPPVFHSEVWLTKHYKRHTLSSAPLHVVEGRFDVLGLDLAVGEIEAGFMLEGEQWLVRGYDVEEERDVAKIRGVRPTAGYDPASADTALVGPPEDLLLTPQTTQNTQSQQVIYYLAFYWIHPIAYFREDVTFEYEVFNPDGTTYDTGTVEEAYYQTDLLTAQEPTGYSARVRTIYPQGPGWTSPWVDVSQ